MALPLFGDRAFSAFFFDMDGTILTSIDAAERVWRIWLAQHGLDVEAILPTIHGRRSVDTVRSLGIPGLDPEREAAAITALEIEDNDGVEPIAGAVPFLASLPAGRWAIVTSAPRDLAKARLAAAGIMLPPLLISGEDVPRGKPHPDPYLVAARRLGFDVRNCVVFEDAPAGIAAGEAAGAALVVITATHLQPMRTPHLEIAGYEGIEALPAAEGIRLAERD
jgi:sugar-phosphatase